MQKTNILQRFIKSVSDFNFSNYFLREKVGKAIGFMLLGYLAFAVIMGAVTLAVVGPEIKGYEESVENIVQQMPDFIIEEGEFKMIGNPEYKIITEGDISVILDLEGEYPESYYAEQYENYFLINEYAIVTNGAELMSFDMFPETLNKSDVEKMPSVITTFFYFGLIVVAVLGVVGVFVISGLIWAEIIIINGFVKNDVSSADCYKVAVYSMVLPSLLLLINWIFNINIPSFSLIYLVLAGLYGYQFLSKYKPGEFDIESIYE